ncbi:hypothetical protein PybrP1_000230 [[Pythium] brassicae (nom. inval.)]|nr:hypothetical protein PybrP1_000230 [[Pythium] brassicae (nom. inval.)]
MHERTRAGFAVNGEMTGPVAVRSGIRQSCPPRTSTLHHSGRSVGAHAGWRHPNTRRSSAYRSRLLFTTQLLSPTSAGTAAAASTTTSFYGLSGLVVQPKKSIAIMLSSTADQPEYAGIPLLAAGATTRYLVVQVERGATDAANRQLRVAALKVRLAVAAHVATSAIERIKIHNTVALPAILFTAQLCRTLDKVYQELESL